MDDSSLSPEAQYDDGSLYLDYDSTLDSCGKCGGSARASDGVDTDEGRRCIGCLDLEKRAALLDTPEFAALAARDDQEAEATRDPRVVELFRQRIQLRRVRNAPTTSGRAARYALAARQHKALRQQIAARFRNFGQKGR